MSTYEVEHNTPDPSTTQSTRRRRPDLSSFFSTLAEISPQPDTSRNRPHAVPVPADVTSAFLSLAEAFDSLRRGEEDGRAGNARDADGENLLSNMIQILLSEAYTPPREVEGVNDEFCDALERIPRASLDRSQVCPICSNPFLDDPYPLVVQLPCHPTHIFDLECIRPWLRLRGNCPLDRMDFGKIEREKAEARRKRPVDDDEEDLDGMYG